MQRLRLEKYLAHLGDVVLQKMLIKGGRNLQPTDKYVDDNFLCIVESFGELILKEIKVRLEAVSLPHSDRKEVVAVSLSLLVGGILGENASVTTVKLWSE